MSLDVFLETEIISDVCFEDNEDVDQEVNIFYIFLESVSTLQSTALKKVMSRSHPTEGCRSGP